TKRGACRAAAGCTNEKVRCGRCENKLTDLASTSFGKPDAAVGTSRNRMRPAVAGWDGEFIDAAIDRDSSDFIARVLGEPQVAIRTGCDPGGIRVRRGNREFPNAKVVRINVSDLVGGGLGKP